MPGTFSYDGSEIVVVDGTEGVPATFADMYDADIAGSLTLLNAGVIDADPDTFSLGTALQSADSKQLKLTISTSADRAGAKITITGTDLDGDAIVETDIDISGANSTPVVTTLKFAGVDASGISVTGMTNADTVTITQPRWGVIWEIVTDGQYKIDCDIDFGDGLTSTYFQSKNEMVYFADGKVFVIEDNATLELGDLAGDYGVDGSTWSLLVTSGYTLIAGTSSAAEFKLYGSILHFRHQAAYVSIRGGTTDIRKSVISFEDFNYYGLLWRINAAISVDGLYMHSMYGFTLGTVLSSLVDVHIHNCKYSVYSQTEGVVFTAVQITSSGIADVHTSSVVGADCTVKNPKTSISTVAIDEAGDWVKEQYTCNIHVTDKDGVDLADVSIDCEYAHLVEGSDSKTYKCIQDHTSVDATHKPITGSDWASFWVLFDASGGLGGIWQTTFAFKAGTQEFAQQTTDANGDISEQTIDYKKWVGTSELLEARIHKFTFTHASYPDVVMSDIIVDHPLVWEFDMGQSDSDLTLLMNASNLAGSNVTQISGDAAAADNLESMFDGVGYNDPEAPAKQSQLSSLANVGAAINIEVSEDNTGGAIKGITFVGSQTLTYAAAQAADGIYHKIDDTTNVIDIVYGFDIGGDGIPTQLSMTGFLNGSNDDLKVFGYDFVTTSWVQISTLVGKAQEVNDSLTFPLFVNMVGTSGADLGKVYIRFQNTGQSDPDLNIDHLFVSHSIVRRTVGYALGAIWIDTTDGIAGTENYVNGTADNPVLTLADALTIATSLGLSHFQIIGGSTITLTSNSDSQLYDGNNWALVLNGQSISGTTVMGADVSGVCTGATKPRFMRCHFGDVTIPPSQLDECGIEGTLTLGSAGTFFIDDCHSGVAGTSTPSLDFGSALNASDVNLREYSGGIEIKNMGAGAGSYNMSIEGNGQLIINANCSADSTIAIRGNFTITNNASGITISDDARYDIDQVADAVLREAIADHSGTSGSLAELLKFVKNVTEGDVEIDTTTDPYQIVVKIKSTETELIRKNLKKLDGSNWTAATSIIGQHKEP